MKLKYYLRGLGIGIIITTVILMIAYSGKKTELTDAEIIKQAESLGMVMKEDPLFPNKEPNEDVKSTEATEMTETVEDTEKLEDTQVLESTEGTESTEGIEHTGGVENTESTGNTDVTESAESTGSTETTESTETTGTTGTTETEDVLTNQESETEEVIEPQVQPEQEGEVENVTEPYHLVIAPGAIPRLICNELEENNVVESAAGLRQYLTDVGYITSIVAGSYDIPYGSTNEEVYQILNAGPIKR